MSMYTTSILRSGNSFHSRDLEETRAGLTKLFTSHSLQLLDVKRALETDVVESKFGESALVYVSYGAPVKIEADELGHCYLFQRSFGEPIQVAKETHTGLCQGDTLSLVSATEPMAMRWGRGSRVLTLKLDRGTLERNLKRMLNRALHKPIVFDPELNATTPQGREWTRMIDTLKNELIHTSAQDTAIAEATENLVACYALKMLGHNYSQELQSLAQEDEPKIIKHAKEFVEANIHESISTRDLAAASGLSSSAITRNFRRCVDMTPLEYIKKRKLDSAREDLQQAPVGTQIAQVALKYGFNHLGRFSEAYRLAFGETPLQTLRNSGP